MSEQLFLSALPVGQSAYVTDIAADTQMRRRLLDIGLIQGTRVTCMAKSPAGDPVAYLIRGAVIALRSVDAKGIRMDNRRERAGKYCAALAFPN